MLSSVPPQGGLKEKQDEVTTLRTLNAFAVDLISIPSVEDLFWYVAQNVVGRLNFPDCVIYRANDAQTELTQVAALGEKNPFGRSILNPLVIPFGEGITGRTAQGREAIIIDDLSKDANYIPDAQLARSEICVPLICGNRVVGVIDSEHPDPSAFGAPELEILVTIAAMTSAKLELLSEADRSKSRYLDLMEAHSQLSIETTNRKALEAELFNSRKLEAIGRLTGQFAHEFNNILTVILGNFEFLEEAVSGSAAENSLNDARGAAERGVTLIQSMLAFSQRTRLLPEVRNLSALVSEICAAEDLAENSGLSLTLADTPSMVSVDPKVLKTILGNLIKNARDATTDGGHVEIATDEVTHGLSDNHSLVTALLPGRYARLSIVDHGIGIPMDGLQQIFDPFYTTKPVGEGSGLGLSMTLGFMQQSGGTVAVRSQLGRGSTFQLYFPIVS